ncbi:MAG: hypothetical protein B7Z55_16860, partial [Planctomycetales bacterium 12-60-4]
HKYDPLTQKEFYQLYAYFHNIGERGRYFKFGNTPPFIYAPTEPQQTKLAEIEARLAAAEARLRPGTATGPLTWKPSLDLTPPEKYTPHYTARFTIATRFAPPAATANIVSKALPEAESAGLRFEMKDGRLQVNLVMRWLDDALRVETERVLTPGQNYHLAFTYDGSKLAAGIKVYVDGKPEKLRVLVDELNQDFLVKEPFTVNAPEVKIFSRALPPLEVAFLAGTANGPEAARRQFLETADAKTWAEVVQIRREREAFLDNVPTVMVMQETGKPLDAHVLIRGAYDRPGDKVSPGVPAIFGTKPITNRLDLARWLVSRENPLTARVTVNRFWQSLFGVGLVKTAEDFGAQGEWPSNPELLDWLAVEFMDSGWDVRHLLK